MSTQRSRPDVTDQTVSNTATTLQTLGFTLEQVRNAEKVWITGSGGDLRVTFNGTTATATVGHLLKDEIFYELIGEDFAQMSLIRQSTDVTVYIELDTFVDA